MSASADIRRMCLEKTAFISVDEAKRARHAIRKRENIRLGIYKCPHCKCFHLTSNKRQNREQ